MSEQSARRKTRVPAGRVERLARIGWMAGEFALGGLGESAKRLLSSAPLDAAEAFLSGPRARKLAQRLARMRGAAMKLGQMVSLEGDDFLPPEFAEALAALRASADAMPVSQVRRVMGRELGKGWEARFQHFDFEPIGSASIGQVHEAIAADGRELALKIQYPGVARSIDSDIDNMASMLRVTKLLPVELHIEEIVEEAKRQLKQEADYLLEAGFLRRYRDLVADEPGLYVPRVHEDLSTKRVLAMDRARGRPIEDLRGADVPQEVRDDVGRRLQHLMLREIFEFRFMQTDPNFANYLYEPASRELVLLDFGSVREFEPEFIAKYVRMVRAMLTLDRDGVRRAAVEIGYLAPDEREDRAEALAELILMISEPLRFEGNYDFEGSDLAARTREAGFDLAFRKGFMRAPPPETIFLHRKLGGTFLLCNHIRAQVNTREILVPLLDELGL